VRFLLFRSTLIISALSFAAVTFGQTGNPAILTGQYDTGRDAANTNEIVLNTSNVNSTQFGKLFSWTVDGDIYAQPLYVPGVVINGTPTNVVYVATMHNSVYAFNADNPGASPLWKANFGPTVPGLAGENPCPSSGMTGTELGILSTPVIDLSSNLLYAVAAAPSGNAYVHYLHAISIVTGLEAANSPVLINASVQGNGYDSQGGTVTLNGSVMNTIQRTSLLLANGSVYAGFGNCGPDTDYWYGWVLGYSKDLLRQTAVFNSTPNSGEGGIWQSARGLLADSNGDVYFATGNATNFNYVVTTGNSTTDANQGNYPMRLVQMSPTGQYMASFPPANYQALNANDLDFSSSGPLLIPNSNSIVAGGKDGIVYVLNTTNPGNPVQNFQATGTGPCNLSGNGCDQIRDLAFWDSRLYIWGVNDILRTYDFTNGSFSTTPSGTAGNVSAYAGVPIAISANGTQQGTGILWAVNSGDSAIHAFNASSVKNELWNSSQNSRRDALPSLPSSLNRL